MRVLMDVLTPKQARFFSKLGRRLRSRGVEVSYTTRSYYESERMLRLLGMRATKLGRWGENPYEKVLFSARRMEAYVKFLAKAKPDLVFTFGSPEASRAAFGLKIPHMMANDSPHTEAVIRLTLPLSRKLFAPWVIPKSVWTRFGISEGDIVQYKGLDQAAWMKGRKIARPVGGPKGSLVVVYRPEEYKAAYVGSEGPSTAVMVKQTLDTLRAELGREVTTIVLARYGHPSMYRKLLGPSINIPGHPVDAVELLKNASVFLGYGGTMTGEAALSGMLAISLSRSPNMIEEFLMREGLLFRSSSAKAAADLILSFLRDEKRIVRQRQRASRLLGRMEDPTERICSFITGQMN